MSDHDDRSAHSVSAQPLGSPETRHGDLLQRIIVTMEHSQELARREESLVAIEAARIAEVAASIAAGLHHVELARSQQVIVPLEPMECAVPTKRWWLFKKPTQTIWFEHRLHPSEEHLLGVSPTGELHVGRYERDLYDLFWEYEGIWTPSHPTMPTSIVLDRLLSVQRALGALSAQIETQQKIRAARL